MSLEQQLGIYTSTKNTKIVFNLSDFDCKLNIYTRARFERWLAFAGDIATFLHVSGIKSGLTVSSIHVAKGAQYYAVISSRNSYGVVPHFSDPEKFDSCKYPFR